MLFNLPAELNLSCEEDVSQAVHASFLSAQAMGHPVFESRLIANAVSEIAGNVIKHAKSGVCLINYARNAKGIEVKISDNGPGMVKISQAMQEGYSSIQGSLGLGLNAAARSVDEFYIRSKPSRGTCVTLRKYLAIPADKINYGVVSFPSMHEHVNGDAYLVKEFKGDKVLLAVIDGSGRGIKANAAAEKVKKLIDRYYKSRLDNIVKRCHASLQVLDETRGVALGLLLLKPRSISFVGVGNIEINLLAGSKALSFFPQNGTLGHFLPDVKVQKIAMRGQVSIVMNTDGIRLPLPERASLAEMQPQQCADYLFNHHSNVEDDSTVLVVERH